MDPSNDAVPIYIPGRSGNRGGKAGTSFPEAQHLRAVNLVADIGGFWNGKFAVHSGYGQFEGSLSGGGSKRSADVKLLLVANLITAGLNQTRQPGDLFNVVVRLIDSVDADRLQICHGERPLVNVGLIIDRALLWVGRDHLCIRMSQPGSIVKAAKAFALEALQAADLYDQGAKH